MTRSANTSQGVSFQTSKMLLYTARSCPTRMPHVSVNRLTTANARTSPGENIGPCILPRGNRGSTRFQWRNASFKSPTASRSWSGE